jgi:hypothetical protein
VLLIVYRGLGGAGENLPTYCYHCTSSSLVMTCGYIDKYSVCRFLYKPHVNVNSNSDSQRYSMQDQGRIWNRIMIRKILKYVTTIMSPSTYLIETVVLLISDIGAV